MNSGILRAVRFSLERWVQRGILRQLLIISALIILVAVLGGVAGWALTESFESLPKAIWWSFLRLTDPGYLGDDEGTVLRVVSTTVTILGYVLFMGSLIAIMTQWLARTIRKLESGLTPIAMENHFVILGWTNRTPEIIKRLLSAGGRLDRFLARREGSSRLRIVVLADQVDAERRQELREALGEDWNENQILLRSGSSLKNEHLARLDIARAAIVMIPGADFELGGAELTDTRVVKTLLTLNAIFRGSATENPPRIVAELFDPRKISIARSSTSAKTEIVAGDRIISRMLSQSLRQRGIAEVLLGLLTHREANSLYVREFPELIGRSVRSLTRAFSRAVVLGVVKGRPSQTVVHLDPPSEVLLEQNDQLVLLAERYDQCVADSVELATEQQVPNRALPPHPQPVQRKLLILGWSYKIPTLLQELHESTRTSCEVTIISRVPTNERERILEHIDVSDKLVLNNVEGDYSHDHELDKVELESFDHILFIASGFMESSEQADARTLLGVLLLRSRLEGVASAPEILVELLDTDNASLLNEAADAIFVSPRMLSHLLAHVGLRPELNEVFDELICAGGADIELHPIEALELTGDGVTFSEIQVAAGNRGCIALGLFAASGDDPTPKTMLNPPRDKCWTLGKKDQVILLCREVAS